MTNNIYMNILFIMVISTIILTVIFRLFNHNKKFRRENIGLLITSALVTNIAIDILLLKIVLWSILLSLLIIIIVKKNNSFPMN